MYSHVLSASHAMLQKKMSVVWCEMSVAPKRKKPSQCYWYFPEPDHTNIELFTKRLGAAATVAE
jgi:hypothetical protein